MQEIMHRMIWNNRVSDYLIVVAVLLLVYILKKRASKNITRLVFFIFRKMGRKINEKEFFELVLAPIENFIVFLTAYLVIDNLVFPHELKFKIFKLGSQKFIEGAADLILILLLFRMLLRVIDYIAIVMEKKASLTEDQSDDQLVIFFREFLKVITIIICLLVLIRFVFHQDISKLLAGLSIAGAAIALAAKESIENLIASFIIFFDKPFTVGDLLKVNAVQGTVEKIGLRSTRIRTIERTYATIPNKQMVDAVVDNLSLRNKRRVELQLHIELKSNVSNIKSFVDQLSIHLDSFEVEEKTVILADIRPDAYQVNVEYFTGLLNVGEFNAFKQQINFMILEILEKNGLSIAGKDKMISVR